MSGKKILFSSTNAMAYHFLTPHIKALIDEGYRVDLACTNLEGYDELLRSRLKGKYETSVKYIRLNRNPFRLSNLKGYYDMKKIIQEGNYDLVSTNEPVMGVITRLAARGHRKKGTKVVYTAHGFHFFKGGPLKNWFIYYPVERIMSYITDVLVTINKEDYERAKRFNAKKVCYIPGIGLNTKKFSESTVDKNKKRNEIEVPEDAIMLFSVGELGSRKNHEVAIRALAKAKNKKLVYVISGEGELEEYLKDLSKKLGIANRVKFLGYRKDIAELCKASDIFVHPSQREGLGIAALEGMAAGLPLIASYINGIRDYTMDGETGFCLEPHDSDGFALAMDKLAEDNSLRKRMGLHNSTIAKKFDVKNVSAILKDVYHSLLDN